MQSLGSEIGDLCDHFNLENFNLAFSGSWYRNQHTWELILTLLATHSPGRTCTGKHAKQHRHLLPSPGLVFEAEDIFITIKKFVLLSRLNGTEWCHELCHEEICYKVVRDLLTLFSSSIKPSIALSRSCLKIFLWALQSIFPPMSYGFSLMSITVISDHITHIPVRHQW